MYMNLVVLVMSIFLTGVSTLSFSQVSKQATKPVRKYTSKRTIQAKSTIQPKTVSKEKKTPVSVPKKKVLVPVKKSKTTTAPSKQDSIKKFIDKLENNPKYIMIESSFSSDGLEWGKYFTEYDLAVGIRLRSYRVGGIFALSNVYRKYFFNSFNLSLGISVGNKKFRKVQENFFEAEVDRSKVYEQYNVFDVEKEFLEMAVELGVGFHYFVNKEFFFGIELAALYLPIYTIIEPEPIFYDDATESDLDMMDHQLKSYAQQPGFSALGLQISVFL